MKIKTLIQVVMMLAGVCLFAKTIKAQSTYQSQTKSKWKQTQFIIKKLWPVA
jgi:tryptophan-rich sensory protein